MNWIKRGLIYCPYNEHDKMASHAQIPVPLHLDGDRYRIYFSSRSTSGRTYPYYLDLNYSTLTVDHIEKHPLLDHGPVGSFDDSGIMPSSIVVHEGRYFMYYIAWNPQVTVSYRLSIGLALSDDGVSFRKYSEGPLLDRSIVEPYFNTAPYVIVENSTFKMWYVSCTGWRSVNGKTEPTYLIRYAESQNGISWTKQATPAIDYNFDGEAIGRPCVIKDGDLYRMWYSTRGSLDYRKKTGQHYNIGYAESEDGLSWDRKDNEVGISTSQHGWDSEMTEYCSVIEINRKKVMFYNGNGFGETGFGCAESK